MYTVHERERLFIYLAALVARDRLGRGLRLNQPEALALMTARILEWAREGMPVVEIMDRGTRILDASKVLDGVAALIPEIQVEATFPDGTKLVTVHNPLQASPQPHGAGSAQAADNSPVAGTFFGAGTATGASPVFPEGGPDATDIDLILKSVPGAFFPRVGELQGLKSRDTLLVEVTNTGDRPIQVGSHFHFFEANKALDFPRAPAWGFRLNIAPGTAIRFEPGLSYEVELIALGGTREVFGCNGLCEGRLDDPEVRTRGLELARSRGYKGA